MDESTWFDKRISILSESPRPPKQRPQPKKPQPKKNEKQTQQNPEHDASEESSDSHEHDISPAKTAPQPIILELDTFSPSRYSKRSDHDGIQIQPVPSATEQVKSETVSPKSAKLVNGDTLDKIFPDTYLELDAPYNKEQSVWQPGSSNWWFF